MDIRRRSNLWMAWCLVMAFLAAGGCVKLCDWLDLPDLIVAPLTTFVLGSAVYFFATGVDAYEKRQSSKRPGFPRDPFAPDH